MRIAALAVCAALAAGCGGTKTVTKTVTVPTVPMVQPATPKADDPVEAIPQIVDRLQPSIVTIFAQTPQGEATGSGVVWDGDGAIVTNNHVVEGATRVQVQFASGARLPAKVKATDPLYDLAVVTIDRHDLLAPTFAGRLPDVGEVAIAMGSPLGFANTVTAGIVSALHRSIPAAGQAPSLVDLIQTDAAISPGNSGGALLNAKGEVIGINVAYIPPQARAVSIGFAIPSPTVVDDVRQLIATGKAEHAFLGIQPLEVNPVIAKRFNLPVGEGAAVAGVVKGSAAAAAGLRQGDVIVRFGTQPVRTVEDLYAALRHYKPGDRVTLTVWRGKKKLTVDVTLRGRAVG
jgi:S1-C subfamily serine protease